MKGVTIRQAMQQVANNPEIDKENLLDVHVHELICRTLFEIANGAQIQQRNSLAKANVARNMIFNRMVGRRRSGSHPATKTQVELTFKPLTGEGP